MTEIYSVFPGMGKTTIFENMQQAGITVSDSDSSKFSWIYVEGEKERNPEFPANYIDHIKGLIGTVDYIFVSTHKEVISALLEEGIDFTVVRPMIKQKEEYLVRYKRRGSVPQFVNLMDVNWDNFIDDIDKSGAKVLVATRMQQSLSHILGIKFELKAGTPGVYLVEDTPELMSVVMSYLCYSNFNNVPAINYIGEWEHFIKEGDIEELIKLNKFVLIKKNPAASMYLKENGIDAKALSGRLPEHRFDLSNIQMDNMYKIPHYPVDSLSEFLQLPFPKVKEIKTIINLHDVKHGLDVSIFTPCININDAIAKFSNMASIVDIAKKSEKVLYVVDAGNITEQEYVLMATIYGAMKDKFGILINIDNLTTDLRIILDKLEIYFGREIIYNEIEALRFMGDWN